MAVKQQNPKWSTKPGAPNRAPSKPGGSNIGIPKAPKGKTVTPGPPDWAESLSGDKRDAYVALYGLFKSYGLETLAPKIYEYVQKGYSSDTISLLLQDTSEWKSRFAANEKRLKDGLPVLSPGEYIATENSYRDLMRQAGLPVGFYDQHSDFTNFIALGVSPSELKDRVQIASDATVAADRSYKDALRQLYGLGDKDITAYFLDPDRALPLLQRQAAASAIGAEALKRGLIADRGVLEQFAAAGITANQASQAYAQIAQSLPDFRGISHQFGEDITQAEMERGLLQPGTAIGGQESASSKLQRLQSWSRARATGVAGTAAAALTAGRSGQI